MNKETKSIDRVVIARDAILDDLYRRFHAGDKTVKPLDPEQSHRWFKPMEQKNCFTGSGTIDCPVCKLGKLKYSRAAYNGHVHGRCSHNNCVSWME